MLRSYKGSLAFCLAAVIAASGCGGSQPPPSSSAAPNTNGAVAAAPVDPPASDLATAASNRCGSASHPWKYLPAKQFDTNTVVDDDCIKLPANHTTKIASGVTLVVIARRGLAIENSVSLDARGVDGSKGSGGEEQIFPAGPNNDADQCLCSGNPAVNAKTCGKMGTAGTPAGNITIIARGIDVDPVRPFVLDVSGGLQGSQGDDSRIHCTQFNPARQFAYGCCKDHPSRANAGDGQLLMQLDSNDVVKAAFERASKPQREPILLTAPRAWRDAADHQLAESVAKGWPALQAAAQPPPP